MEKPITQRETTAKSAIENYNSDPQWFHREFNIQDYAAKFGYAVSTAQLHLNILAQRDFLNFTGKGITKIYNGIKK